jgi:hypothetical protein
VICARHQFSPTQKLRTIRALEAQHDIRLQVRADDCLRGLGAR